MVSRRLDAPLAETPRSMAKPDALSCHGRLPELGITGLVPSDDKSGLTPHRKASTDERGILGRDRHGARNVRRCPSHALRVLSVRQAGSRSLCPGVATCSPIRFNGKGTGKPPLPRRSGHRGSPLNGSFERLAR